MRFEDERYVRLYTRDSATWAMLPWEGRCLLPLLLRKLDRAGLLEVVPGEEAQAVANLVQIPIEVVEPGLKAMLARSVVVISNGELRWPKYREAQECQQSDKLRQQKSREIAALGKHLSHAVTAGHTPSHGVTPSHAVPSRAVPVETCESPDDLQELWNAEADSRLARVGKLGPERKRKAAARLKEAPLAYWRTVVACINKTPFLLGESDGGWRANFDWLLKPDSATRVLEGKYDRGTGPPPKPNAPKPPAANITTGELSL